MGKRWGKTSFKILFIATTISIAFIIAVYLLSAISMVSSVRYAMLFTLSYIFSFFLFKIIFKQQDKLRADREQTIKLFEHISDGIIILDGNRSILEMNEAARDLLGENRNPTLFCDICQHSHGQLRICDYEKCFLDYNRLSYYELHLKHKEKGQIPVSVSTSTFIGVDNKPSTIISIRNLSDYRKGEQNRINHIVTTSIIRAQEEERKRLSRELHDGIGQSIFSVQLGLEYMMSLVENEQAIDQIDSLRKQTKQTLEEIRHMAVELRPSVLDDLGLVAAIKSYIKTYSDTFGIQVNFEYTGDRERVNSNMETALYRITQEALTNVAKYADSNRVDITMSKYEHEFILKVTDFGIGFSIDDLNDINKGVGLYSMEERASMLNGTFHITSQIGKGTEIEVRIPLRKDGEDE